ncbi:probable E3 SUMO-protein ligase RNF212 isoform X2 [Alexandromys fortis]|uniref:probable E3 SUMO-protein ligase RNF212 isoform X2 n=1 Tax=Alexandromys fortis TaxID=100897 RepID=UPI0021532FDD|nr:probable E3 SUMO-protein ligase RNF212 isoform X2 [Microtus fortis]
MCLLWSDTNHKQIQGICDCPHGKRCRSIGGVHVKQNMLQPTLKVSSSLQLPQEICHDFVPSAAEMYCLTRFQNFKKNTGGDWWPSIKKRFLSWKSPSESHCYKSSNYKAKPNGCLLLPPNSSLPDRIESMEIDPTPQARKPEMAAGPSRISLISPPQDGRMGSVSCRGPQHLNLTPSHASMKTTTAIRVPPLQMPFKERSPAPASQLSSRAAQGPSPSISGSWSGLPRQPISISGLLQRQCAGSASPGGMNTEKMNPFLPSTPANLRSTASPWHVYVHR